MAKIIKFAYLTIFFISLFLVLTDAGRMRAIKCTNDAGCVHAFSNLNLEYCPPPNLPFCSNATNPNSKCGGVIRDHEDGCWLELKRYVEAR
ncbi:hypothetical protein P8452_43919 [Trifolium repens]|nr:hypothetical protein P8452_43919 [Trifolium repens]